MQRLLRLGIGDRPGSARATSVAHKLGRSVSAHMI